MTAQQRSAAERERQSDLPPARTFSALAPDQCRELLRTRDVARVAWQGPGGLEVLPVTYAWDGQAVVFRCAVDSALAALREPTPVVVEVDDLDARTRTGWSVLVRGTTAETAPSTPLRDAEPRREPVPWASGERPVYVRVVPERVTGRLLARER